jgi:hypothetical protein
MRDGDVSRVDMRVWKWEVEGVEGEGDLLLITNRIPRTILQRPTQLIIRLPSVHSTYLSLKDVERKMEDDVPSYLHHSRMRGDQYRNAMLPVR